MSSSRDNRFVLVGQFCQLMIVKNEALLREKPRRRKKVVVVVVVISGRQQHLEKPYKRYKVFQTFGEWNLLVFKPGGGNIINF